FVERGSYVDKDFFNIFSFDLVKGDPEKALDQINSLVISEKLANKYFGNDNPLGKAIQFNGKEDMLITGVMKDVPHNSHMQFDYVMSIEKFGVGKPELQTDWGRNFIYSYVKTGSGANIAVLNDKIKNEIKKNSEGSVTDIYLQPLTDIHLGEVNFTADISGKGNKTYVQIFSIVAAFILLIACINFMNLSTARSAKRAKEVGLRKTVGASRYQLVYQFLGESVMISLLSMMLALLFVDMLLPSFNYLSGKSLDLGLLEAGHGLKMLISMIGAAIFTGLLAGSYPAIFLSSFQPASVLKGKSSKSANPVFRKALVILQFTVSIVLIIGTITVSTQLDYIQNKNLGIDKEQVVILQSLGENYEVFKNELLSEEGIVSVGVSDQHPVYVQNSTSGISWPGANPDETILIHTQSVDAGYIPTMKIEIAEGRHFSESIVSDSSAVIVNQKALETMGFQEPIGAHLTYNNKEYTIIGVAKDFHFKSAHQPIEPLVLFMEDEHFEKMLIKVDGGAVAQAMSKIQTQWEKLNPKNTFNASFLDDDFNELYASEERTATLFKCFSALAIIISCLGLFGLASYMAEQRTKEISIRKVFGAPVGGLFYLVSKDFTLLVFISFIISVPIGWYLMNMWLDAFAYKINMGVSVFFMAGASALIVALITVSYQSIKAAMSDPAKVLRND
ncbi:ABC transporter permease, partial [Fulvivirga kasyanovii]